MTDYTHGKRLLPPLEPDVQPVKGGPSEAAIEAAAKTLLPGVGVPEPERDVWVAESVVDARAALAAAHDPALGLDRSVRLGEVLEWLERLDDERANWRAVCTLLRSALAREFGTSIYGAMKR